LIVDRLFLYADDVVLFTAARQQDLVLTRGILELFAADANLEATVTPLNYFPAKLSPFPIKYLGTPLFIGQLRRVICSLWLIGLLMLCLLGRLGC